MHNCDIIHYAKVFENSPLVVHDRVEFDDGELITQATTDSITVKVFDEDGELINEPEYSVEDCIFDELETDNWEEDSQGWNSRLVLAGSNWPEAGQYFAEIKYTPNEGEPVYAVWSVTAENIFSE